MIRMNNISKLFSRLFLITLLTCSTSFAQISTSDLAGFDEKRDLPQLNDILRSLTAKVNAISSSSPTGMLVMWPTTEAPTDWLLCDGSAVSRTQYSALFNIIGTTFGSGDGSTTFNLPNFKSRFPVGLDPGGTFTTLGATGGSETSVSLAHTHKLTDNGNNNSNMNHNTNRHANTDGTYVYGTAGAGPGSLPELTTTTDSKLSTISLLNPYIVINFIIKD